jgi:hypothetical protein
MNRPHAGAVLRTALAAALIAGPAGCSDSGSVAAIDQKSAIAKASGPDGKARQSAKAKTAAEEAAKKHPKLR